MPPTVQDQSSRREHASGSGSTSRTGATEREKRSELYSCRVKYNNTLPDIPFDPKFIAYPFDMNRYVQYKPTSLEKNFKSELLTEVDLGIPIELIDTSFYKCNPNDALDLGDERLLEEDTGSGSVGGQNWKRSKQHARNISWLRRTEYISSELGRYGLSNDKSEIKIGAQIKKLMKEEDLYRDRESQIKAIEKTFEDNKEPIEKHHSKQGVYKVDEYPVFPDFKLWAHPYAQVIFDADPAPKDRPVEEQISDMSQAMIRGMMDESGDQFVAYFLPTEETRKKRKMDSEEGLQFTPGQEYQYKLTREYGWTVKNKASKGYEETYFFIFRPNDKGVFYNELETRVRLNKRRKLNQHGAPNNMYQLTNSMLVVTHRDYNANEIAAQESRLTQLEPAIPEDDEEEEEEDQEGEASGEEEEEENNSDQEVKGQDGDEVVKQQDAESEKGADDSDDSTGNKNEEDKSEDESSQKQQDNEDSKTAENEATVSSEEEDQADSSEEEEVEENSD